MAFCLQWLHFLYLNIHSRLRLLFLYYFMSLGHCWKSEIIFWTGYTVTLYLYMYMYIFDCNIIIIINITIMSSKTMHQSILN